jgi:hypothetical protein
MSRDNFWYIIKFLRLLLFCLERVFCTVKRKKKKSATKHFTHARITHLKKTYTTTEKGTLAFFFVPRVRVSRLSRKMETAYLAISFTGYVQPDCVTSILFYNLLFVFANIKCKQSLIPFFNYLLANMIFCLESTVFYSKYCDPKLIIFSHARFIFSTSNQICLHLIKNS